MYKAVIGLEVHCEIKSTSKNFSGSPNKYSLIPNINISPIDIGYPGILPVINKYATKQALKTALALNCTTPKYLSFERKNYFYPDLPKGYQITQMYNPVGINGYLIINIKGKDKKVLIHDTHLEEDTASLEHYQNYSLIDYNRCGVPLLETVTEPCLNSSEEAIAFLEAYRNLLLYCDISEARADRGQIRCDVNVSLMKEDSEELGTRVEMKNINSFIKVKSAIECEIKRQTEILNKGGTIKQETRRYDAETDTTYSMRKKEDAIDYKYFTEPNLPPIPITDDFIDEIKKEIPRLQYERLNTYIKEYKLQEKDANTLARNKELSDFYEQTVSLGANPIESSNYITGQILAYLNKDELSIKDIFITPQMLTNLLNMQKKGQISSKQTKDILNKSLEEDKDPIELINKLGLSQITDKDTITEIINNILEENPKLINDYKNSKNVLGFIIGQVMKKSNGKANPKLTNDILVEILQNK